MKKWLTISFLSIFCLSLIGFELSWEKCCSGELTFYWGEQPDCSDCCDDEDNEADHHKSECCDHPSISKSSVFVESTPPAEFELKLLPAMLVQTSFALNSSQVHHPVSDLYHDYYSDTPIYLICSVFRC